jgi:hypothetical protein
MSIKEILTYDLAKSERFVSLARVFNFLFAVFFFWLGERGIATQHLRFKRYDYYGVDAQLFGVGLCALAGAWVLYTTFGGLFVRYRWCRVVTALFGIIFIVCATVALVRNI